jgi:hypothetical protein
MAKWYTTVILLIVFIIEISLFLKVDLSTWGEHITSNSYITDVYSIQDHVIKFVSELRQVCGFQRVLRFTPPPRYNWNIVESGFKHHNPKYLLVSA